MRLMLSDCQSPLTGRLVGDDIPLKGFSIDTRSLRAGDLYIAITGDRYDGHDYALEAEQRGASGLIVHQSVQSRLPQLHVADTRLALTQLAQLWAAGHQVPTVAITGSNGKTTVKEIVASILRQLGPVLATKGNLNNDIGVPLTLLRLRQRHRYAVIEMGANHRGEIAALSALVKPDVAVITNIGAAHLQGFGSIADVAQAKMEIFSSLAADGWAVINADDGFADTLRMGVSNNRLRLFGFTEDADVCGVDGPKLKIQLHGELLQPRFRLLGKHNFTNALAACAAVQCLDVQNPTISAGLAAVRTAAGRLELKRGANGSTIIDDTYNANPESVRAAIDVLVTAAGNRHLVLGDMAELGGDADNLHAQIGHYAQSQGIDELWTVGTLAAFSANAFNQGPRCIESTL